VKLFNAKLCTTARLCKLTSVKIVPVVLEKNEDLLFSWICEAFVGLNQTEYF